MNRSYSSEIMYLEEATVDIHDMAQAGATREQLKAAAKSLTPSLLERLWPAAVTILSLDDAARKGAQSLIEVSKKLSPHHIVDTELSVLLAVLDDEPVVIIDPETRLGIEGVMSGVPNNEILHVLVMEQLLNGDEYSEYGLSKDVLAVAHGTGPRETADKVYLEWNMYIWQALSPDKTVPDGNDMSDKGLWIWDIDLPADIPVFDGHRVILLGSPSYARYWKARRPFDLLRANIALIKELSTDDVDEWLEKIVNRVSNC